MSRDDFTGNEQFYVRQLAVAAQVANGRIQPGAVVDKYHVRAQSQRALPPSYPAAAGRGKTAVGTTPAERTAAAATTRQQPRHPGTDQRINKQKMLLTETR